MMLIFRWPLEMRLGPSVSLWLVSMPELAEKRFFPSMLHMF
uniref:Alternative protein PRPF18 n=1 Tax=Homo sapiens TaxID=9606 RepID=L8E7W4_HUMAN|nr:alternative protein PRPF18 [Homo sapiens]